MTEPNEQMSRNVVRVTEYDGEDITGMKIYQDTETKQYKHRLTCKTCGVALSCVCYDNLSDAFDECDGRVVVYCDRHLILTIYGDEQMEEMIDDLCGTDLLSRIKSIEMIERGETYPDATNRYKSERVDELITECDNIVRNLTDAQIDAVMKEIDHDFDDLDGHSCDV